MMINFHTTPQILNCQNCQNPFWRFWQYRFGAICEKISVNDDQQPEGCISEGTLKKLKTLEDRQRKVSRQKVIARMYEFPDNQRDVYVDDVIERDNIVLFVATSASQQTCELTISRDKYDSFKLLELIERMNK